MSDEFGFEEGDTVLVRIREFGSMKAKFVAPCTDIEDDRTMTSPRARFDFPAGTMDTVTLPPYGAEFEVVESHEEVNF